MLMFHLLNNILIVAKSIPQTRYVIYFYGGYNGAADYQQALSLASSGVSRHYVNTGSLGESFAVIYDKLNQTRTFVWMEDATHVKYRRVQC